MEADDSVEVIIPTYQRFQRVQQAIASALNQTHLPLHVTVIDDASQDPQYRMLDDLYKDNPNVSIQHLPKNMKEAYNVKSAQGLTRNVGIDMTQSKWIAFLDDDDVYIDTNKISMQIKLMEKHQCLFSCTNMKIGNGAYNQQLSYQSYFQNRLIGELIVEEPGVSRVKKELVDKNNVISCSTTIISRELLKKVGNFKTGNFEDWQCWKLVLQHTDCLYINRDCVYYDAGTQKHYQVVQ